MNSFMILLIALGFISKAEQIDALDAVSKTAYFYICSVSHDGCPQPHRVHDEVL